MKRLALVPLLALAIAPAATLAGGTAAAPHRLAPATICNMANRLNVFVDEDSILWACECEVLAKGFICKWQVIGGVDAASTRRRIRAKLHVQFIPRVVPL